VGHDLLIDGGRFATSPAVDALAAGLPLARPQGEWRYAMNTNTADRTTAKTSAARLRNSMEDLVNQLRSEVNRVTDPRAQALFETTAEALGGLITAFEHYDEGRETAFSA
jgi:hypothetical protein